MLTLLRTILLDTGKYIILEDFYLFNISLTSFIITQLELKFCDIKISYSSKSQGVKNIYTNDNSKVHLVKAMVFPIIMYGCESWAIKKAEHWRIDAFELWCWRRLLRVPWTVRRANQSILKEISPEYSLEGPMLKLKLQYFGHLMWRTDSLEKTLMLGKIEGRRGRGWQSMR